MRQKEKNPRHQQEKKTLQTKAPQEHLITATQGQWDSASAPGSSTKAGSSYPCSYSGKG